jgi:hypothetical protein
MNKHIDPFSKGRGPWRRKINGFLLQGMFFEYRLPKYTTNISKLELKKVAEKYDLREQKFG